MAHIVDLSKNYMKHFSLRFIFNEIYRGLLWNAAVW